MKTLTIIFLICSFNCFSQEKWLVYLEDYRVLTEQKRTSLVFYFTKDSAVTYVPHYGYFKWKIEYTNLKKDEYYYLISEGKVKLSHGEHRSELIISQRNILQLLWLGGDPEVLLVIEFKRRHPKF